MKKIHKDDFDGFIRFKSKNAFSKSSGRNAHLKQKTFQDKIVKKLISKKENQEFRKCLICNSKSNEILFNKNGYNHVVCKRCNFVFVNPILKSKVQEDLVKGNIYNDSYTKVLKNKVNIKLNNLKFQYGLQKIKTKSTNKRILDFGPGHGLFLDNAKKLGWKCYANEVNKIYLKTLKEKKIILDNQLKKNFYDAITLWLVLEHIPYPNRLFKKIYNSLKKNGKILIQVPNINSLTSLILKDKCTTFSGEQHVNFFSDITLKKFLNKNNFKILSLETIISDAGSVINYLSFNNLLKYRSNKSYPFVNSKFIHKNMLGYTLLVIAQKK